MKALTTILLGIFLTFCSHQPNVLQQVRERGELRVVTVNNPTTFYEGADGLTGFEKDLASLFAQELGVRLRPVFVEGPHAIPDALNSGLGDFSAAGLLATAGLKKILRFGPSYQTISQQVVYRRGSRRPRHLDDIRDQTLVVVADSAEADFLASKTAEHPGLRWQERGDTGQHELLNLVWEKAIDLTVANSNEVALTQRYYPELKVAFELGNSGNLAWAFPRNTDDSLYVAALHFINRVRRDGTITQLIERHYGHTDNFDYVGTRKLIIHARERLPKFADAFRAAGKKTGLDWRLLAAIGYQESHWNPAARSPTGVRGIMQMTLAAAKQMQVADRRDPAQSIDGGSRYFRHVLGKIPERIGEPDRTWLALAAYNIGFGHLEDARKLADAEGRNPDLWLDVKAYLPRLSDKQWYPKTRHGFARGREAVRYVTNIRRYYDLLVWLDNQADVSEPVPKLDDAMLSFPLK